jgi:hypothetical protein
MSLDSRMLESLIIHLDVRIVNSHHLFVFLSDVIPCGRIPAILENGL